MLEEMTDADAVEMDADGKKPVGFVSLRFAGERDRSVFTRLTGVRQTSKDRGANDAEMVENARFEIWPGRHPNRAMRTALVPFRPLSARRQEGKVSRLCGR